MSYDKEYAQKYYQKNKEKINKQAIEWQRNHHEVMLKASREYRARNKEKNNEDSRKRYQKRKEAFEKEYGIMARNIKKERVAKYLENPAYYKEKLQGKINAEQLEIAYDYLDDIHGSLRQTGKKYHKSKERVRQIVYKVLFKVWKMNPPEREIMEEEVQIILPKKSNGYNNPMTQEKFDKVKKLLYQGLSSNEIYEQIRVAKSSIDRIRRSNTVEEYRELGRVWYKNSQKGKYKKHNQEENSISQPTVEQPSVPVIEDPPEITLTVSDKKESLREEIKATRQKLRVLIEQYLILEAKKLWEIKADEEEMVNTIKEKYLI